MASKKTNPSGLAGRAGVLEEAELDSIDTSNFTTLNHLRATWIARRFALKPTVAALIAELALEVRGE